MIKCPVMVVHGEQDHVVPFWQGEKLYELAPEPKMKRWVPNAGHNDLFMTDVDGYWDSWGKFVEIWGVLHKGT